MVLEAVMRRVLWYYAAIDMYLRRLQVSSSAILTGAAEWCLWRVNRWLFLCYCIRRGVVGRGSRRRPGILPIFLTLWNWTDVVLYNRLICIILIILIFASPLTNNQEIHLITNTILKIWVTTNRKCCLETRHNWIVKRYIFGNFNNTFQVCPKFVRFTAINHLDGLTGNRSSFQPVRPSCLTGIQSILFVSLFQSSLAVTIVINDGSEKHNQTM